MLFKFLIQPLLEARTEICKEFHCFFGVIEDKKKNLLRFSDITDFEKIQEPKNVNAPPEKI